MGKNREQTESFLIFII